MKIISKIMAGIAALTCLTGCGNNLSESSSDYNNTAVPADVQQSEDGKKSDGDKSAKEKNSVSDTEYDVDLTKLNSSMVYAQVADMVNNGDNYLGKSVKAKGSFGYYKETDGREFFAVLVSDATACCSQGIEFVLDGDHKYPDDYPAIGTEIIVTGDFNYYNEGNAVYCQLLHANMEIDTSLSWSK